MKYRSFRFLNLSLITIYFALTTCGTAQAQVPPKFSYQSIIRNPAGQALQNQTVGMRLSILQTSETGTAVYVETHSATTNAYGLVTLQVGGGTVVSGSMASINWDNGPFFIKTETDPEGGSNYSLTGTSQLLSVPFALYSANGTPGPQGPQGPQGESGPAGPQGTAGAQGPAGQTGATGTQGPIGLAGPAGATGPQGPAGQDGSNGTNGADGKAILNGTTNPISGIGNNGDFYLNTSTNTLFGPKVAGTWPASGTSLVGPAGSIGPKGDKGDTGATGPPGTGISGGTTPGQLLLWNGSSWLPINPGTAGQALTICNGLPTWTSNGICPASSLPSLSTSAPASITSTSANSGGNITNDGGGSIITRGVCWSTTQNPTTSLSTKTEDGGGAGIFSSSMNGLAPGTSYFVRAYATNTIGTSYGNQQSFTTLTQLADITTTEISSISATGAVSGGNITAGGGAPITSRGVCWSTSPNPTIALSTKTSDGTGTGSFSSIISGLAPVTTYFVRAYAINSVGVVYGAEFSFATLVAIPTLTTTPATALTPISVSTGGNISSNGGGQIIVAAVCWSTSPNPTVFDFNSLQFNISGNGNFTVNIFKLNPGTTYYLRAFAENSAGIGYGNEISFTTPPYFIPGSGVVDIDGNAYQSIILGTQEWMKENLKTSKYRNGNPIPTNLSDTAWQNTSSGAYAIYNNDAANNTIYGKLYNWYTVADSRGLCPAGWHVPAEHDWNLLTIYLDSEADTNCAYCPSSTFAGGTMKSTGTIQAGTGLWFTPNTNATNSSGFTGLPGSNRNPDGSFGGPSYGIGFTCYWWSSTENSSTDTWFRSLGYAGGDLGGYYFNKGNGYSVRCLRD